jgi:parallel beta-helix repeat protein
MPFLAAAVTSILCGAAAAGVRPALAETLPSCSLYAATSGSDANSGSSSSPLRTAAALIKRVQAGQTGCLASGQSFNENVTVRSGETHGAEGAPVTITSVNPASPAVINGRFVTETGADWLTFTHLAFTYSEHGNPSPTVGSKHTTWTYDDITAPTTICFNLVNGSWGVAENTLIEHDRIHNCGSLEKFVCNENSTFCSTPPNDGFFIHGVYVGGARSTTIRNNYIYENADRGVQVRSGSNGVLIEHNIIDRNGEGIIFGDGATNVTARYNIITNSHAPCGEKAFCYNYGALEYNAVAPNFLANNDIYGNQCASGPIACFPVANVGSMSHVSVEHNTEVDPQYVNGAAHEYTLRATSAVAGYGPDASLTETTTTLKEPVTTLKEPTPTVTEPPTSTSPSPTPVPPTTTEPIPTKTPTNNGHHRAGTKTAAVSLTAHRAAKPHSSRKHDHHHAKPRAKRHHHPKRASGHRRTRS